MAATRDDGVTFEDAATEVILGLAEGEIATYGEIAEEAGFPGAARAVGRMLSGSEGLPWWRVVAANGRLVPHHEKEHARRLRSEGVEIRNGRVAKSS